jgi:ParB-like nuclease domain
VKKLAGEIETAGELDPILVIRLGDAWVCVDGHHRVRAYQQVEREGTIKCEWFGGSVREAVDEGMRRNRTIKLEVHRADRQEQAWKRTLLRWGSKNEVVRLCGVSEGVVAEMRRVRDLASASTEEGEAFRQRLDGPITEKSWSLARLTYKEAKPAEIDIEQRAGVLARRMNSRLEGKLSEDPEVTARALAIYDPELPTPLTIALLKTPPAEARTEQRTSERLMSA